MPVVAASIEIAISDDLRVRRREGGGFHLLIGAPGQHVAKLTFADVAAAELLAVVLTTSAISYGPLGTPPPADAPNVVRLVPPPRRPTDFPPPSAA